MKITLYKNCILNNSYTEVFNMKKTVVKDGKTISVLDAYLATLDNYVYENDYIYTEGNGSFQIDFDLNEVDVYSYNYLKVEETDIESGFAFIRYCFIDDIIKIASNVFSVYYTEDVWSSYSGTMFIRDGVISNKYRSPKTPYYLPILYDGNNYPTFEKIGDFDGQFIIVCQLQLYKLEQEGIANNRLTYTAILCKSQLVAEPRGTKHNPTLFTDTDVLNRLVRGVASEKLKFVIFRAGSQQVENYNYEIDNFTVIPATQEIVDKLGMFGNIGIIDTSEFSDDDQYTVAMLDMLDRPSGSGYYRQEYYTTQIQNDFTNISFGSILSQYGIVANGSSIDVKIELVPTKFDFKILLYIQNKVIDITNDFVVKMPFTSVNSEENTTRKLQRELATIRGAFDIVDGTAQTATQIAGAVMTGGLSLLGGTVSESTSMVRYNYRRNSDDLSSVSKKSSNVSNRSASSSGLMGGVMKIANGITDIVYANKPKYSSTQGTFSTSDAVTNAINGFGVVKIVPDNDLYITELLKRTGYTVFMTVKDYDGVFGNIDDYDVIKMTTVILYGNFPQNIVFELTEILRNGIRVFNSENVTI